ncbi:MAG: fluoride efflux transporter CrcB [bacterium]|nr:fluoride efflux transporter CrcB [bacterium]
MKQTATGILLVGAGGFLGSVLRYGLSGLVHRWLPASSFPHGTLAVNLVGCLAIGLLGGIADSRQLIGPGLRLFLFLGLLGGFTTFSTFGYETHALARGSETTRALANVMLHVVLGLAAVWVGYSLSRVFEV